jgi:hypothetical protein
VLRDMKSWLRIWRCTIDTKSQSLDVGRRK